MKENNVFEVSRVVEYISYDEVVFSRANQNRKSGTGIIFGRDIETGVPYILSVAGSDGSFIIYLPIPPTRPHPLYKRRQQNWLLGDFFSNYR